MKGPSGIERKLSKYGYIFILPFLLTYLAFQLWPIIYTILLSFSDLKGLRADFTLIGLENYKKLITDKYFWEAIQNTGIVWFFNFVPQLGIALLFALWFTDDTLKIKYKGIFRTIFYLPNLLSAASVAMLYRSLFAYPVGPVNSFLTSLGIWSTRVGENGQIIQEAFNFFRSVPMTRGIVSYIQWWLWTGSTLILLIAGIVGISPSIFESAMIDGANKTQRAWYITIPLLRPMMLYLLITSMIGGMQMFEIPFLLTDMRGGPDYKIRTMMVYFYNTAFQGGNNYAYGAAISVGIFIITLILAVIIFFMMRERQTKVTE
ncbi:MAG TPA: sugar ABC transporter permease [Treponema sp.]|nr:sugar ABC transporter permease [Treponema sp.]HPC71846.1 sugar ABC transporter permease [Treponema sp.]HRS04290.1 sugar ABC transporter permease [Treponema sp.]HRU28931.1 sugar ABC transporter permease [Treponema sp.]